VTKPTANRLFSLPNCFEIVTTGYPILLVPSAPAAERFGESPDASYLLRESSSKWQVSVGWARE
jgi:hypothetical protein